MFYDVCWLNKLNYICSITVCYSHLCFLTKEAMTIVNNHDSCNIYYITYLVSPHSEINCCIHHNIHCSVFQPVLPHIQMLWELVLTGEVSTIFKASVMEATSASQLLCSCVEVIWHQNTNLYACAQS